MSNERPKHIALINARPEVQEQALLRMAEKGSVWAQKALVLHRTEQLSLHDAIIKAATG